MMKTSGSDSEFYFKNLRLTEELRAMKEKEKKLLDYISKLEKSIKEQSNVQRISKYIQTDTLSTFGNMSFPNLGNITKRTFIVAVYLFLF